MEPNDIPKTAIITPIGLFEYVFMTFGLRNAAQSMQRFIDRIIRDIPCCCAYVDDLLIASADHESHKETPRSRLQQTWRARNHRGLDDLVKNKVKRDNTPVVWNDVTKSAFESCKKLITNATALSFPAADARLSLMTDASDFAVGSVIQQHIQSTVEPLGFFSRKLFSQIDLLNSNDYSRLSEDQSSDLELQSLMGSATGLEFRPMYFAHSDKYFYCDLSKGLVRQYVTKQFRRQIFNQLHNLSHPGVKATQKLISARFVWKNLNKDCALWCKSCTQCQRSEVSRHTKSPVGTFPLSSARFSNVHIDVVGPLSLVRGMSYLLACVDRFTRWPEVFPIPDQTADTIARTFLLGWIARFGVPERITSYRGTNFQSDLFFFSFKVF
ncbi:transposon Ty3-I Gag-Pol polyprotein [Trichonephila clavipes]|nr:transposon Ty3-I Gag-Pol polyprotein [Trichonephila clavipes]